MRRELVVFWIHSAGVHLRGYVTVHAKHTCIFWCPHTFLACTATTSCSKPANASHACFLGRGRIRDPCTPCSSRPSALCQRTFRPGRPRLPLWHRAAPKH